MAEAQGAYHNGGSRGAGDALKAGPASAEAQQLLVMLPTLRMAARSFAFSTPKQLETARTLGQP
jgi:hypothetical protein